MRRIQFLILLLAIQLALPITCLAAPAGKTTSANSPVPQKLNLDLTSTQKSVSASLANIAGSLAINIAGTATAVNSESMLTPAEFVALLQVSSGAKQTLGIATTGSATNGSFSLSSAVAGEVNNLVIPRCVQLIENFSGLASIALSGSLTNSGKIIAYSSNPGQTLADISALNIYNEPGALISSLLSDAASYTPSNSALAANLGMTVAAAQNIVNYGRIVSAGDLNLSAGGSVQNLARAGLAQPVLQAANNLNISSANIVNNGLLAAQTGNININTITSSDIVINNIGGQIQALQGAINIRNAAFNQANNLTITGGSLLSQSLNLYSGTGTVTLNADNVSGLLNIQAGVAHTLVSANDLTLGDIALSGDPTFITTQAI